MELERRIPPVFAFQLRILEREGADRFHSEARVQRGKLLDDLKTLCLNESKGA